MLTLSLVFEDRNDHGELTDYHRFDLDTAAGLHLAQTMVGDGEWFHLMMDDHETDVELRCALLGFITAYIPDALS
jgi:hypothetical protein